MDISEIAQAVRPLEQLGTPISTVDGVAYDSRLVQPGYAFVAIPGTQDNGLRYLSQALERGARLIIAEEPVPAPVGVAVWRVADARLALSRIAAALHHHPSADFPVVGITGTNGKTTTAAMVDHIVSAAGWTCGRIGTVEYRIGQRVLPADRTTPHAPELQTMLGQMRDHECKVGILEVSSHALDQHRVADVQFDVAVFTNLTQDHLDYHGTMESYYEAKARLFRELLPEQGDASVRVVINQDDPWGRRLLEDPTVTAKAWSYGIDACADFRAESVEDTPDGVRFRMVTPEGTATVQLVLPGRHNVSNALAAAATAHCLGLPLETVIDGLEGLTSVPGRMERIPGAAGEVYVDYAHTPDALEHACRTLRPRAQGRLWVVFGCGGDRDRAKRPLMARAAAAFADRLIVTNDNPRSESPADIAADILAGVGETPCEVILDRARAITTGIDALQAGDVLLIAGKGHEGTMQIGHQIVPFDDREAARAVIAANQFGGASR